MILDTKTTVSLIRSKIVELLSPMQKLFKPLLLTSLRRPIVLPIQCFNKCHVTPFGFGDCVVVFSALFACHFRFMSEIMSDKSPGGFRDEALRARRAQELNHMLCFYTRRIEATATSFANQVSFILVRINPTRFQMSSWSSCRRVRGVVFILFESSYRILSVVLIVGATELDLVQNFFCIIGQIAIKPNFYLRNILKKFLIRSYISSNYIKYLA